MKTLYIEDRGDVYRVSFTTGEEPVIVLYELGRMYLGIDWAFSDLPPHLQNRILKRIANFEHENNRILGS